MRATASVAAQAVAASAVVGEHRWAEPYSRLNLASNELHHARARALIGHALGRLSVESANSYARETGVAAQLRQHFVPDAAGVVLAPGSDAAIQSICQHFAPAANQIINLLPNYSAWDVYAALYGITMRAVGTASGSRSEAVQSLVDAAWTAERSIVTLASPDPVSGYALAEDARADLVRACQRRGHLLVVDSCYVFFQRDFHGSWPDTLPGTIQIVSLSKGLGLAGARVAAVLGDAELLKVLLRGRIEGGVSALTVELLDHLLSANPSAWPEVWSDIGRQRARVTQALGTLLPAWHVESGDGNFATLIAPAMADHHRLLMTADRRSTPVRDLEPRGLALGIRITIGDASVTDEIVRLAEAATA